MICIMLSVSVVCINHIIFAIENIENEDGVVESENTTTTGISSKNNNRTVGKFGMFG